MLMYIIHTLKKLSEVIFFFDTAIMSINRGINVIM